jgi:hypothetical protein
MAAYVRLTKVEWTSSPLVAFPAMEASIAARFGLPTARDLDTNGIGLFDCHLLRFACGLEVALWRLHLDLQGRQIDPRQSRPCSKCMPTSSSRACAVPP